MWSCDTNHAGFYGESGYGFSRWKNTVKERACVFVGFVSNLIYSGIITICATDINIIKKIKGDLKNQP